MSSTSPLTVTSCLFSPTASLPWCSWPSWAMIGDAANNAAAAIAISDSVFFMFVVVLDCRCLLFDFPAANHFLSTVRIGDSCRCLHPILVEHWAVVDLVTGLSGRQLPCFRAEFLECRPRVFQRSAFGQLGPFRAEITSCCLRAAKIIGYERVVS